MTYKTLGSLGQVEPGGQPWGSARATPGGKDHPHRKASSLGEVGLKKSRFLSFLRRYRNERLGIWAGTGGHPFPLPVCRLLPPKPEEPGTRRALTDVTCLPCALPCLTASLWPSETHRVGPGLTARNPVPLKVQDARPACSVPLHAPRLHPRWGPAATQPSDWLQTDQQVSGAGHLRVSRGHLLAQHWGAPLGG